MSAIGGDITEITFNHPTLGTGVIYPKAGEDSTINTGGVRGNDDNAQIDGSGKTIRQLNRRRWSVETVVAWEMNDRDTLELLSDLAGDPVEADYTITHINGTVWAGKGAPVGDMDGNGNAATFDLKLAGGGKLEKI